MGHEQSTAYGTSHVTERCGTRCELVAMKMHIGRFIDKLQHYTHMNASTARDAQDEWVQIKQRMDDHLAWVARVDAFEGMASDDGYSDRQKRPRSTSNERLTDPGVFGEMMRRGGRSPDYTAPPRPTPRSRSPPITGRQLKPNYNDSDVQSAQSQLT